MPPVNPFLVLEPRIAALERALFVLQEQNTRLAFELNHIRGQSLGNNDVVTGGAGNVTTIPPPPGGADQFTLALTTPVKQSMSADSPTAGSLGDALVRSKRGEMLALLPNHEVSDGYADYGQAKWVFMTIRIGADQVPVKYALPIACLTD